MTPADFDVAIVGAGLAGLSCARHLAKMGQSIVVLEADDAPGGRVRTDEVEGFLLDRGFQVLLTAYPEAEKQLDYERLHLRALEPGALVWRAGRFHRFTDPFRRPLQAFPSLFDETISLSDKLRVARLRLQASRLLRAGLSTQPDRFTVAYLSSFGFSPSAIDRFFRPFFGGVFLESELHSSSNWFLYLFHLFAVGLAAVPSRGMQAIPAQIAAELAQGTVLFNSRVLRYQSAAQASPHITVWLENGTRMTARHLVLATAEHEARRMAKLSNNLTLMSRLPLRNWNQTTTFYYAADHAPLSDAMILLNGEGASGGPVNNAVVITNSAPSYAPAGAHLISASVVGAAPESELAREQLEADVRAHLARWFGRAVEGWRLLGAYFLPYAVPLQQSFDPGQVPSPGKLASKSAARKSKGSQATSYVVACGDFAQSASIQGALLSGRATADWLQAHGNRK